MNDKKTRGYLLVDVPVYEVLWPDLDCIVAVMEYVRTCFWVFAPKLPHDALVEVFAGVTSHSGGPIPLLGVHLLSGNDKAVDTVKIEADIECWCRSQSVEELKELARTITSPTWNDLLSEHEARFK